MLTKTPNVLLRGEESDGAVSAIEVASAPGFKGPPLHLPREQRAAVARGEFVAAFTGILTVASRW